MAAVYVLSKAGKPLMPTTRCGHVRHLLKQKKAKVVATKPFTIQLLYGCPEWVQPLVLGIDPGRTNIGVAVVKEDSGSVFSAEVRTRNKDIPKLMTSRKAFRQAHRRLGRRKVRQRRARKAGTVVESGTIKRILPGCEEPIVCKLIRNKEARFNNRKRPAGWLTPTANQLLLTHLNVVKKVQKILPISDIVLELNRFAFMAMDNPNIRRWEYQKGPLHGFGSVEVAASASQDGHCIFCEKSIEHYHHVVPVSKGGSDTMDNRVGICEKHHHLVHTDAAWREKLASKKAGLNKKYRALSVLNQVIPHLERELAAAFPGHCFVTDGQSTKAFRDANGVEKTHHSDAYCIACSILPSAKISAPEQMFEIRQFRRHDRQVVHKAMLDRKYYLDGKLVATNRHKSTEQFSDSLEEFVAKGGDVSRLVVKEHKPIYKRHDRWMPGSIVSFNGTVGVLGHSAGFHNGKVDYYFNTKGKRFLSSKCILLAHPTGLVVV